MKKIILASTSRYRKELLEKTGLFFECEKPDYEEDRFKNEALAHKKTGLQIAEILSKGKAEAVFSKHQKSDILVIAGDQLVVFKNEIIGKAGEFEKAYSQLKKMNQQTHELITAVTLMTSEKTWHLNHVTKLKMKNLGDTEIKNYLNHDQPFDCAGSYKIEKSGLILFEKVECDDFTAIQGLPLVWITNHLKELGYEFFKK